MVHHASSPREICSFGPEGSPAVPTRKAVSGIGRLPTWQLQQPCSLGSCLHRLLRDGRHLSHVIGAQALHTQHTLASDLPGPPWGAKICRHSWCRVSHQMGTLQPKSDIAVLGHVAGRCGSLLCQ